MEWNAEKNEVRITPALHNTDRVRAGIRAPRMTILGVVRFRKHHEGDLCDSYLSCFFLVLK